VYFGKSGEKNQNKIIESKNAIINLMEELAKDTLFLVILSNLNEYSFDEMKLLYTITKTALIFAQSGESTRMKSFVFNNINKLVDSILENIKLASMKTESVVYIVCRILRLFFKHKAYLEKILTFDFFKKIYVASNSEKFVVSSEIFRTLLYIITKPKVDWEVFNNFLNESKSKVCNLFFTTMVSNELQENYLVKRETLIFLNKIFENTRFYQFTEYFSNDVNNLKMILINMNDECIKIKLESINILYYFFVDIHNETLIKILLANKQNFYQFFTELEKELNGEQNANLIEKRNFIYYELEKMEN